MEALAEGVANISATAKVKDREITATCRVTVVPVKIKTLTLSAHQLTIDNGDGVELSATFTPADAIPSLQWSVSDESVLEIVPGSDESSVTLKPLNAGTAVVKVEADGQSDECEVTVMDITGIESVFGDKLQGEIKIYDLSGRRVNGQNLKPGVYIVRQGTETKKVMVK